MAVDSRRGADRPRRSRNRNNNYKEKEIALSEMKKWLLPR
jgi:hypothetical protein